MSAHPLVTVLLLSYNNGDYIYSAIDSILEQTYSNIELIVSDDASADFDVEKVTSYIENHRASNIKKVIYNLNDSNMQTVAHVEKLISMCTGDFITMIAADDAYYDENVIEKVMYYFSIRQELDVVMGHTAMYDINLEKYASLFTTNDEVRLINSGDNKRIFERLAVKIFMPAMGVFYKKKVFDCIGQLSDSYRLTEDWPIHLRVVRNNMHFYFADFIAGKHRDGGISHGNVTGGNELLLTMREDLLRVMEKEILPFISGMSASAQKDIRKIYHDRVKTFEKEKIYLATQKMEEKNSGDNKSDELKRKNIQFSNPELNKIKSNMSIINADSDMTIENVCELNQLVSIIVVCYNNEQYIISTLNSILMQTYRNIELIITDDNSTDNTVKVVEAWIDNNREHFIAVKFLTVNQNTGVSANCNRGISHAHGDFIKIIAGDDILQDYYVEKMLQGIGENDIAFCYACLFCDEKELEEPIENLMRMPESLDTYYLPPETLYKKQLVRNDFNAPTMFVRKEVYEELGGFDETYPMMEDLPFYLKCIKANKKIAFITINGVLYRRSIKSISRGVSQFSLEKEDAHQKMFKESFDAFMKIRKKEMIRLRMWRELYLSFGDDFYRQQCQNASKKSFVQRLFLKATILFAPFTRYDRRTEIISWKMTRRNDQHVQVHRLKNEILRLKYEKIDRLYRLKREELLKLRELKRQFMRKRMSMPLFWSDRLLYHEMKEYYKNERKKIKTDYKKWISDRKKYFSMKERLIRWDKRVQDKARSLENRNIPKILRLPVLVLSPLVFYRKGMTLVMNYAEKHSSSMLSIMINNRKRCALIKSAMPIEGSSIGLIDLKRIDKYLRSQEKQYLKHKSGNVLSVVFVIHLLASFAAVETIYLAMKGDVRFSPKILIVPRIQPGMGDTCYKYDKGIERYMEERNYDYTLGFSDNHWVTILDFEPDAVFYQTPYENQHHPVYSYKYARVFPRIFYTPYGPWVMDKSVEEYIKDGLNPLFFERLSIAFMDKLSYEMALYAAPQYKNKYILAGSPKVDFYRKELITSRYCWCNPQANKKVIWMPRWGIKDDRTSFGDYYKFFIDFVSLNREVDFVMRPHPFLFSDIRRTGYLSDEQLDVVISQFDNGVNTRIDYNNDYREGLLSCDFLVMDFSSIIYEYLPTLKPVIYTPKDNTLVDSRIMDACYVAKDERELRSIFEMLLIGEDPLYEKRKEIVEELQYFPNESYNGEYIKNYIVEYFMTNKER